MSSFTFTLLTFVQFGICLKPSYLYLIAIVLKFYIYGYTCQTLIATLIRLPYFTFLAPNFFLQELQNMLLYVFIKCVYQFL